MAPYSRVNLHVFYHSGKGVCAEVETGCVILLHHPDTQIYTIAIPTNGKVIAPEIKPIMRYLVNIFMLFILFCINFVGISIIKIARGE